MAILEENKVIVRLLRDRIGGAPKVFRYRDESNSNFIDIFCSRHRPVREITTYATVGLSNYDIDYSVNDVPLRVEFIGASDNEFTCFPNIVVSCAFNIIKFEYSCFPGAIYSDIIEQYLPASPMKHILFVPPFLWEGSLENAVFTEKIVTWLMPVPISENELQYAKHYGSEALGDQLEKHEADVCNLLRKSIV